MNFLRKIGGSCECQEPRQRWVSVKPAQLPRRDVSLVRVFRTGKCDRRDAKMPGAYTERRRNVVEPVRRGIRTGLSPRQTPAPASAKSCDGNFALPRLRSQTPTERRPVAWQSRSLVFACSGRLVVGLWLPRMGDRTSLPLCASSSTPSFRSGPIPALLRSPSCRSHVRESFAHIASPQRKLSFCLYST